MTCPNEVGVGERARVVPNVRVSFHRRASEVASVYAFQRRLWDDGILCTIRATRGDDERAACGQLATDAAKGSTARTVPAVG